uniref:Uncharacterized protein n=1 Tax=Loa loa TaxID=7209 RepID=A0A1I7W5S8_LOALO
MDMYGQKDGGQGVSVQNGMKDLYYCHLLLFLSDMWLKGNDLQTFSRPSDTTLESEGVLVYVDFATTRFCFITQFFFENEKEVIIGCCYR